MMMSRRDMVESAIASTAFLLSSHIDQVKAAPPSPFKPAPRMPLSKFLQSDPMLKALRKGIAAMKERKAYDPFSWFYQAAIHGVLPEVADTQRAELAAISDAEAAKFDAVFQKRYWNQCPHNGEEAANFLPWHRAYTYYFERILRLHTEDDDFSLPYWDYESKNYRKFPREFGEPFIGGDPSQKNPLFMKERDFYFARYDHPFAVGLPLLELTDEAVDSTETLATSVFFGESETEGLGGGYADEDGTTRGMMESRPHDHIHRAVGGIIIQPNGQPALGAMSQPPTAGFDPIFPIHHSNIDRLWASWSCMPGKQWGKLPPAYWFEERPWFFWDVGDGGDSVRVNEPRRMYFDHRALGVSFEGEDLNCKPLTLPTLSEEFVVASGVERRQQVEIAAEQVIDIPMLPLGRTVVPVNAEAGKQLAATSSAVRAAVAASDGSPAGARILMRLMNLDLGFVPATGFDVYVTTKPNAPLRRSDISFVGSVALFRHQRSRAVGDGTNTHGHDAPTTMHDAGDTFDVSQALAVAEGGEFADLKVVIVPYPLLTIPGQATVHLPALAPSRAAGLQFLTLR